MSLSFAACPSHAAGALASPELGQHSDLERAARRYARAVGSEATRHRIITDDRHH
jgi:hypothetical protein